VTGRLGDTGNDEAPRSCFFVPAHQPLAPAPMKLFTQVCACYVLQCMCCSACVAVRVLELSTQVGAAPLHHRSAPPCALTLASGVCCLSLCAARCQLCMTQAAGTGTPAEMSHMLVTAFELERLLLEGKPNPISCQVSRVCQQGACVCARGRTPPMKAHDQPASRSICARARVLTAASPGVP
jgi:hypothetical protein